IPSAKIFYIGWLTKEAHLKRASSIVVEFIEPEMANAIIYAGMSELNRLEEMERNKRLAIRQLEEEKVRLRSSIDGLSITVRELTEDEQAKVDSIASLKAQHQSTNNKLVEKEMGLRQSIDFLEVRRERLEVDIKAATEEKDVLSQEPLADKQIVNSMRGGSQDIDELRQATERRQPLENVPSTPDEGRAEEDEAVGLEYMTRSAFDSEEEHLAPTEDIPLPLFSRALPAACDRPLEAPMGNQTEEAIEDRSAVPEDGEKVRVAFKILEKGEWIVDRGVVADAEDPSEVQRLSIKYQRRDMGLFSSKNRVLACFDRVRSNGTDAETQDFVKSMTADVAKQAAPQPNNTYPGLLASKNLFTKCPINKYVQD
ncbi:hypothetical protein G3M48_010441, partial [Beauveria asiatica]